MESDQHRFVPPDPSRTCRAPHPGRREEEAPDEPVSRLVVRDPGDLIGLIGYLLGFRPEESLVMVALRGSEVSFTARVDLPTSRAAGVEAAATLSPVACQQSADGVVLVAFSADRDAAVGRVRELVGMMAVDVIVALAADAASWASVGPDGVVGVGAYDPVSGRAATEAVYAGLVMLPDREAVVARTRRADAAAVSEVAEELVAAQRSAIASEALGVEPVDALGVEPVDALATAALLADPAVPWTAADLAAVLVLIGDDDGFALAVASIPVPPRAHVERWADAARRAPRGHTEAAGLLAGMAAWLGGDGALARSWLERVEAETGVSAVTELLARLVDGVRPPARRPARIR